MKKLFSFILIVLLLLTGLQMPTFAAGSSQTKLSISSAKVFPGETFEIKVNLENNPGIVSANLKVTFDEGLTLVGATNGKVFSTLTYVPPKKLSTGNPITSSCQFAWIGFDIADKDIKNGTVLTLTFKLSETAKSANRYSISVYNEKGNVIDRNLNEISLSAKGVVEVIVSDDNGTSPSQSVIQKIIDMLKSLIKKLLSIFSIDR